jgi:hypothetical protein
MKKAGYASLLIVLALGGFLYGRAVNRTGPAAGTEGVRAGGSGAAAEQWEYCAVSKAGYTGSTRGGTYWISYFKENGVEIVEVEEKASEQQGAQIARAFARLGDEGWEMVGQGDLPVKSGRFEAIYFKRRKA